VRIYDLGDGDPEYAVVACLHGDETCGLRAVEHLRAQRGRLREPLRLVVANERALDAGQRAVDTDLNRAFPGDSDGETHERRLAVEVLDAVRDTTVLDLHSTVSSEEPFTIVVDATERALELAAASGTDHVVEASYVGGGLLSHVDGVAVECGLKQSAAAAGNAVRIVARFLAAADLLDRPEDLLTETLPDPTPGHGLPARTPATPPTVYRIDGELGRRGDEFDGENFVRVEPGEQYGHRDGDPLTADGEFYPVLMSSDGYDEKLGFRGEQIGSLPEVDAEML
jgi:hypothetical protein